MNLLMLPGLLSTERFWSEQAKTLHELADKITVSIPSIPVTDTIAGMAEDILQQAPERFGLLGHSLGGYIALQIMAMAPERVTCLGLFNTSHLGDQPAATAARWKMIAAVEAGEFAAVSRRLSDFLMQPVRQNQAAIREMIDTMAEEIGPDVFMQHQKAIMVRDDHSSILPAITCPTLIVSGEEDKVVSPEVSRLMQQKIAGASLVIIPATGHMTPIESPAVVSTAIAELINACH